MIGFVVAAIGARDRLHLQVEVGVQLVYPIGAAHVHLVQDFVQRQVVERRVRSERIEHPLAVLRRGARRSSVRYAHGRLRKRRGQPSENRRHAENAQTSLLRVCVRYGIADKHGRRSAASFEFVHPVRAPVVRLATVILLPGGGHSEEEEEEIQLHENPSVQDYTWYYIQRHMRDTQVRIQERLPLILRRTNFLPPRDYALHILVKQSQLTNQRRSTRRRGWTNHGRELQRR